MLILVDMDGVITDFTGAVCREHNKETGEDLKPEDITGWELKDFGIKDETWQKPKFFRALDPYAGAIETLWKMQILGHKLWIVTNAMNVEYIEKEKAEWVRENIPFVRGIVFTDKKHELLGDILIDDCPEYLEKYPGTTVKINHPYNKGVKADYTYNSLAEAAEILC